jgi:PEP-CTERM motif
MKRMVLMALLCMALSGAAFAGSVDFTNYGGVLSGSSAGLSLTGSELIVAGGLGGGGMVTGALGSVSFTTGALLSGTLAGNPNSASVFSASGSSFTITGNGTDGIPNGVIFSGTFDTPIDWELVTSGKYNYYILHGGIKGTWYNGSSVSGVTNQVTLKISTGNGFFSSTAMLGSGDTVITTVPEPGTLGLLGTGMIGLAGVLRRKFRA